MMSKLITGLPPEASPIPYPGSVVTPAENFEFVGRTCQIVMGVRWHCELGGWVPNGPFAWKPGLVVAKAELYSKIGESFELVRGAEIKATDIASDPPINDERDVATFLVTRKLPEGMHKIIITYTVTSFGLPDLGQGPLIIYLAGNVQLSVDRAPMFSKTYASSGGDMTLSDEIRIISSNAEK